MSVRGTAAGIVVAQVVQKLARSLSVMEFMVPQQDLVKASKSKLLYMNKKKKTSGLHP